MVMRQQPLYAPAVRSSREHPPDERQLSASPRASPFPSPEILQCRIVNMASARSRFSFVFASLLPSRAFLCIARGHGPAPSRKSGPAKRPNFTHQPRRSACKARTGWASTLRRRRISAASQLSVGTRIWARVPSISTLCALAPQPISTAPGKRMSLEVADVHDGRVGSTS